MSIPSKMLLNSTFVGALAVPGAVVVDHLVRYVCILVIAFLPQAILDKRWAEWLDLHGQSLEPI